MVQWTGLGEGRGQGTWVLVHQAPFNPTVMPKQQIDLSYHGMMSPMELVLIGQRDGSVGNGACRQA